jgi:hypothetical protein
LNRARAELRQPERSKKESWVVVSTCVSVLRRRVEAKSGRHGRGWRQEERSKQVKARREPTRRFVSFRFVLLPWADRILDGFGGLHVRARDGRRARTALRKWRNGKRGGALGSMVTRVPRSLASGATSRGVGTREQPRFLHLSLCSTISYRKKKKKEKNRAASPDWSSR